MHAQVEAARSAAADATPLRAVAEELDAFVQGSSKAGGAGQQGADDLKGVVNALVKGMEQVRWGVMHTHGPCTHTRKHSTDQAPPYII